MSGNTKPALVMPTLSKNASMCICTVAPKFTGISHMALSNSASNEQAAISATVNAGPKTACLAATKRSMVIAKNTPGALTNAPE